MALYMAVFFGGTPFGAPLVGAVAETFGARWSLISGGVISATAAVVAAVLLARREGIQLRDELRERPWQRTPDANLVETGHRA
jgi:hypothetical protein